MKKKIAAAALAALTLCAYPTGVCAAESAASTSTTQSALRIDDVSVKDWCAPAVRYVVAYDLMDCKDIGGNHIVFSPDIAITRQEIAEALYRTTKMVYPTLTSGEWGNGAKARVMFDYADIDQNCLEGVEFCISMSVMNGDGKHYLHPKDSITREEFAAVLTRYTKMLYQHNMIEEISQGTTLEKAFSDQNEIANWAVESVAFCLNNQLMNGNQNGSFSPKGEITRAQTAQVLYNLAPEKSKT